jgi:hypothetical protein
MTSEEMKAKSSEELGLLLPQLYQTGANVQLTINAVLEELNSRKPEDVERTQDIVPEVIDSDV